jgi:hypothetical protein
MNNDTPRSFSAAQRWNVSLSVTLSVIALAALVLMVNYLALRHFKRVSLAANAKTELSPFTQRTLAMLTNDVAVTVYYDKNEPVFESVWQLLKEYSFANSRLRVEVVDYTRDAGAAQLVKARYQLGQATDKNLVIFDSGGRRKVVTQGELSEYDTQALISGKSSEVRRTAFKGEMLFTSAILNVTSFASLKAYFLQGHGEHQPESEDALAGFSEFAAVLSQNNIKYDKLNLAAMPEVPPNCHLLIVAGTRDPLLPEELERIDRYLRQGGRLLALFSYNSIDKDTGLEGLLAAWRVAVGRNVVRDAENTINGQDVIVSAFGNHAITWPLFESRLHVLLPRTVSKAQDPAAAEGAVVELLAFSGPRARVLTDIRKGYPYDGPRDHVGKVPLIAAVEKGRLSGVSADRGTTRLIVAGDSTFLSNRLIGSAANRDFASLAVNWLLDRSQFVGPLGPKPIKEYKLNITRSQMTSVKWLLLLAMPGAVVLLGLLVSLRRRK